MRLNCTGGPSTGFPARAAALGALGLLLSACPWSRTGAWDQTRCVPECAPQGRVCYQGECVLLDAAAHPPDLRPDAVVTDGPNDADQVSGDGPRRDGMREAAVILPDASRPDSRASDLLPADLLPADLLPADLPGGKQDTRVKLTCVGIWHCFQLCWHPASTVPVATCANNCRLQACSVAAENRANTLYTCARNQCGCECGVVSNTACWDLPRCNTCLTAKCPTPFTTCKNTVCPP